MFDPFVSSGLASAEITPAVQADTPQSPKLQVQRETDGWIVMYAQFAALWRQRSTDEIAEDHPMRGWVNCQRKLDRTGNLRPWKRHMLDSIAFPYESSDAPANRDIATYEGNVISARAPALRTNWAQRWEAGSQWPARGAATASRASVQFFEFLDLRWRVFQLRIARPKFHSM